MNFLSILLRCLFVSSSSCSFYFPLRSCSCRKWSWDLSCRVETSWVVSACLPACLEARQDARLSSFCIIALVIVVLVDRLLRLLAPRLGLTQLPQGNSSSNNNSDKGRQQQQQQQLRNVNKRTFQLCLRLLHFKGVCASLSQSLSLLLTIPFSFTLFCWCHALCKSLRLCVNLSAACGWFEWQNASVWLWVRVCACVWVCATMCVRLC